MVSVPSRGAIFLNYYGYAVFETENTLFPSPLGELYFLINVP